MPDVENEEIVMNYMRVRGLLAEEALQTLCGQSQERIDFTETLGNPERQASIKRKQTAERHEKHRKECLEARADLFQFVMNTGDYNVRSNKLCKIVDQLEVTEELDSFRKYDDEVPLYFRLNRYDDRDQSDGMRFNYQDVFDNR